MDFESIDGVIIEIWNKYSTKFIEQGICTELNEVDGNYEICVIHDNARRLIKFKKTDKKEGCTTCNTKQLISKIPKRINPDDYFYPTNDEVVLAYINLRDKVKSREFFIGKVYQALFDVPFNWDCGGCKNNNSMKLKNHITEVLKIEI